MDTVYDEIKRLKKDSGQILGNKVWRTRSNFRKEKLLIL